MVYLPDPDRLQSTYSSAYNSILASRRHSRISSSSAVTILVAPEMDALCAAKMLSLLFKQDDVLHRVIPVSGYPGLEQLRDKLMLIEELHTLILLNIGSILDLPSPDWFGSFRDKVTVHVIDSARPQNLSSLFDLGPASQRILVWDDRHAQNLTEEKKAYEALIDEPEPDSDEDSDSDMSDEDEMDRRESSVDPTDDTEEGPPRQRRRIDANNNETRRLPRQERYRHRARMEKYYASGTHYGQSAAGIIYLLATELERADNDLLWLSILGLTFQYTTARIPRDRYDAYHAIFEDEVARLNPPMPASNSSVHPDDTSVRPSEELRFSHFRQWNLYDSMYHSSYVASKLGIWKEKGRKRLQGLLAKMGFSLQECQQSFAHMNMDLKRDLREKMDQIAPEYGLVELVYPSFVRSFGYRSQPLCAADVVDGVSALLEVATGVRLEVEVEGGRGGGEWFGGGKVWNLGKWDKENKENIPAILAAGGQKKTKPDENGNDDEGESENQEERWWERNFWVAFDALGNDIGLLRESLPLSMALQRAVIRQGSSLIDKQSIRSFRTFRLAVVKEGPDLALFAHPGILSRLALWLVDAQRERAEMMNAGKGKRKHLPLVVACLDEKAGSYLIVGVTAPPEYGDVRKNQFGLAFLEAKQRSNARTRHGTFDTSIVEVNKDDLSMFIEALQLRA